MNGYCLKFPVSPGPHPMDQITDRDREVLGGLVKDAENVVEIGTFIGGSAEVILEAMSGHLLTIDHYKGSEGTNTRIAVDEAGDYIKKYAFERLARFRDRLTMIAGESVEAAKIYPEGQADVVFIDGSHAYEGVAADIEAWFPALKPTGIMVGHDFDRTSPVKLSDEELIKRSHLEWDRETGVHWGVVRAVMEKFEKVDLPEGDTTIWWARPEWKR